MVVRMSKGRFDPEHLGEAKELLVQSEAALCAALQSLLSGPLNYHVGPGSEQGYLTHASIWASLEHSRQMVSFAPMLARRPLREAAGIRVEPITSHGTNWRASLGAQR